MQAVRVVLPRVGVVMALVAALSWLGLDTDRARAAQAPVAVARAPVTLAQVPLGEAMPQQGHRPRVGLVLSGGGARGAAHIGVLKVLEDLHVPIDAIAGTSMGAVVGGLYASGLTAREIEAVMSSVNWQEAFRDRPPRAELSFRRKEEDRDFLVKFPLGIRGGKIQLPKGLIEGQTLTMMLRRLTLPVARIDQFADLPTPFRAVATDLASGEPVVMQTGDLTSAMRASLSAPGLFTPVEREGRVLVDGGIAENLPIDVARAMGVDVLIVVDVGFPLYTRERLGSATTISNQMLAILIRRDSQRQLATLAPQDILVSPQLGDASSFDFGMIPRAIATGADAAQAAADRLRQLAVSPETYTGYVARRDSVRSPPPRVDFVHIKSAPQSYVKDLQTVFNQLVGAPLDAYQVERRVAEFYGRGDLALLDYRLVQGDDQYGLDLTAQRNSWGPNYVRFGLSLQDDFQGNATYNAGARIVLSQITPPGGEWVWDLQMGVDPHIATEVYLPLTQSAEYFFFMPHAEFGARNFPLDDTDLREIAEYRIRTLRYGVDFGRQFGNWGEIRTGILHEEGREYVRIGDPSDPDLPTIPFNANGYFVRFSYDRLDDVDFPRDGQLASVEWDAERNQLGQYENYRRLSANWLVAHSFGRETAVLWTSAGAGLDQTDPHDVRELFTLGGLFNLSGIPAQSLTGQQYAIARALFYRKIGRGGEGIFDFPAYVGFSLEAGNVWQNRGDINWSSARKDGSIFLGLDTLVGPLYLATGYDDSGRQAFYLVLGRTF
jgi:NTE family protein